MAVVQLEVNNLAQPILSGNLLFKSNTGFVMTLDHAITAARTLTLPDTTDTVVVANLAQTLAGKTFTGVVNLTLIDGGSIISNTSIYSYIKHDAAAWDIFTKATGDSALSRFRIPSGTDVVTIAMANANLLFGHNMAIQTNAANGTILLFQAYEAGAYVTVASLNSSATTANWTFSRTVTLTGLTASELIATDASRNLVSLAVATYPSLAELAYVKGVTSAIQTQLGLKAPLASPTFTGSAQINATSAFGGLTIQVTSDGAAGGKLFFKHISANPAVSDQILSIGVNAKNSIDAEVQYGYMQIIITNVTSTTEASKFELNLKEAGADNLALALTGAGVLSVDLAGTGTPAQVDLFDQYDDALVLRQGIQQNNRELLTSIGVLTRKDTGSGYLMNLQPMVRLLAGGIYQTRQMLEDTKEELLTRLVAVEAKLAGA